LSQAQAKDRHEEARTEEVSHETSDTPPLEAPLRQLERSFIEEFVRSRGHDPLKLDDLPVSERNALLSEASVYASAKLAEVESRAHYLHEIHDGRAGSD
jgi:hypothetical protein